jgi:hypothetical protein
MLMIDIKCPGCGKAFRVKDGVNVQAFSGKKVKCPACAAFLDIPGRFDTPTPAAEIPSPQETGRNLGGMAATADERTGAMTTEERLTALEGEQAETKAKLAQLEKALEAQRQEVRSRGFVLVEENGEVRAKLGIIGKDGAGLDLWDENGMHRAGLYVDKEGPKLNLGDENEKVRVGLGVDKDRPRLELGDENEKVCAALGVGKNGPVLNLWDENGERRVTLCVNEEGAALNIADGNGERRALLCENKDGPWLCLYDGNGMRRAALEVIKDGPLLVLCNGKERTIWEAP